MGRWRRIDRPLALVRLIVTSVGDLEGFRTQMSVKMFNLRGDEWDERRGREGWQIREAFVGHRIGARLIGASMSEVEPGAKLWPYHTHHANEEWVIVVHGEPTLRTHEGERELAEGDVVRFPRGQAGAHQIMNRTASPIRVLMLSTMIQPDVTVVELPDGFETADPSSARRPDEDFAARQVFGHIA